MRDRTLPFDRRTRDNISRYASTNLSLQNYEFGRELRDIRNFWVLPRFLPSFSHVLPFSRRSFDGDYIHMQRIHHRRNFSKQVSSFK